MFADIMYSTSQKIAFMTFALPTKKEKEALLGIGLIDA